MNIFCSFVLHMFATFMFHIQLLDLIVSKKLTDNRCSNYISFSHLCSVLTLLIGTVIV
jgi:hypothetical protein